MLFNFTQRHPSEISPSNSTWPKCYIFQSSNLENTEDAKNAWQLQKRINNFAGLDQAYDNKIALSGIDMCIYYYKTCV